MLERQLPERSQLDSAPAPGTDEQRRPQPLLERGDLVRDRGLRVAECLCRGPEGAFLGDGDERPQVSRIDRLIGE
jgi:hypothetical protein